MDTTTLIQESKARFSHNSAKAYLKEKYDSLLIIADQGGLWKADVTTLNFLSSTSDEEVILIDTFNNPIKVNRATLYDKLWQTYKQVMSDYLQEWNNLENKR